jgi:hypothetical protein
MLPAMKTPLLKSPKVIPQKRKALEDKIQQGITELEGVLG